MAERPTRILLVEDNDDHAELVTRALDEHGIAVQITRAPDGAQALAYLQRTGEWADAPAPDVVFLDLRLPRVDGLEVLRQIKAMPELVGLPVVVLTTSAADRDLIAAYESHVNAYVVKPVDHESLDRMLRETSAFWLAWNRKP